MGQQRVWCRWGPGSEGIRTVGSRCGAVGGRGQVNACAVCVECPHGNVRVIAARRNAETRTNNRMSILKCMATVCRNGSRHALCAVCCVVIVVIRNAGVNGRIRGYRYCSEQIGGERWKSVLKLTQACAATRRVVNLSVVP